MLVSKAPMRASAAPSRRAHARARAGPPQAPERLRAAAARARAWAARRPATTLMLGVSSATLLVAARLGRLDALAEVAALVAARPARLPPEAWLLALLLSSAGRTAFSVLAALATARWFDRALDARDARLAAAEARQRALARFAAELLAHLEAAAAVAPEAAAPLSPRELTDFGAWFRRQLAAQDAALRGVARRRPAAPEAPPPRWIADLFAERREAEEARPAEQGESVMLRRVLEAERRALERLLRDDTAADDARAAPWRAEERARLEALFATPPAEASRDGGDDEGEEEGGSDA